MSILLVLHENRVLLLIRIHWHLLVDHVLTVLAYNLRLELHARVVGRYSLMLHTLWHRTHVYNIPVQILLCYNTT
jgi:hypothetical protein